MVNDKGISKTKLLLVLLIVLVFLLGLFAGSRIFYHDDYYPGNETQLSTSSSVAPTTQEIPVGEDIDPATVYLVNLGEEQVDSVRLTNAAGEMFFTPAEVKAPGEKPKTAAETVYTLEDPDWDIVNQAEIQTLVQSLLTIRYKKAFDAADVPADVGFEHPTAKVLYTLSDKTELELKLGKTLSGGEAYAQVSGDPKVYLLSTPAERLQRGLLSYLSGEIQVQDNKSIKQLIFMRASDQSELSFAVINKALQPTPSPTPGPTLSPSVSPSVTPAPLNLAERKWQLTAPMLWDAKSSDINSMVSEFALLYPQEYVAYGEVDWAEYGLDKPAYTIVLQSDYDESTLQIGAAAGVGRRYARLTQYPLVFVLNMSQLSMLDQNLMDLLNPYLASININAVKALQINDAGEEIKAEIMVPTKEEMTADPEIKESFRVNGWNADITSSGSEHYFKQFYRSLIALQIDGVDRRAPEDYAADFKIMYTLKSNMQDLPTKALPDEEGGWQIRLDFAERNANSYYVYLNGQASGFYMKKSQLETNNNGLKGFRETWADLSEAIQKQNDGIYDKAPESD